MIELDVNTLTGAEVDLIEDTLNEQLAARLGDNIVTFSHVLDEIISLTPNGPKPTGIRIPIGKLMRTLELVMMRRVNPAAAWADTGQQMLRPEVEPPPAPAVDVSDALAREVSTWPTPLLSDSSS